MIPNHLAQERPGRASPPTGPNWLHVACAALAATLLLFSGPLRCTAPVVTPPSSLAENCIATNATTWSPDREVLR